MSHCDERVRERNGSRKRGLAASEIVGAWAGRPLWLRSSLIAALVTIAASSGASFVIGRAGNGKGATVEVISITAAQPQIHRSIEPRSTELAVTLRVLGSVPKGAAATVEVGTYSSKPPGDEISYSPPQQRVALSPGLIRLRFYVSANPKTVAGTLVIAATIGPTSRGIERLSMQPEYTQWRTTLETAVP